jgi:hypothetical protein
MIFFKEEVIMVIISIFLTIGLICLIILSGVLFIFVKINRPKSIKNNNDQNISYGESIRADENYNINKKEKHIEVKKSEIIENDSLDSLFNILEIIIKDKGPDILENTKLLKGLLFDHSKGELKKEIAFLIQILNIGCYNRLKKSVELEIDKSKIIKELIDGYYINSMAAEKVINNLAGIMSRLSL